MNNKILKKHKIDEKYVLSERKFLYTFGYLCLENDLIGNENMNKKQLYYFLEQRLQPASEASVDFYNVATGKIILVGRGNNFRAYYRPEEKNNIVEDKPIVSETRIRRAQEDYQEYSKPINAMKLSELLNKYNECFESDESLLYLEEILSRTNLERNASSRQLARKYKNKIKCYRRYNNGN